MSVLRFDEATHRYWVGDMEIPSVTQIIKQQGLMKGEGFFTKRGRERGAAVHMACALLAWDNLDWTSVDDEIKPYVESYGLFKEATKLKPRRTEFMFWHPRLLFAGTWDQDFDCQTIQDVLVDLKSGGPQKTDGVQTAMYQEGALANHIRIQHRAGLYLQPDGSIAKLREYKDANDLKIGLCALRLCQEEEKFQQVCAPYRENIRRWMEA